MAKQKLDGVVEAVRYTPDGQVLWVRAYMRRGPTYSDRLILQREALVDALKAGKVLYAGKRIELMASTFEVTRPLKLIQKDGRNVVVVGDQPTDKDRLEGIPLV